MVSSLPLSATAAITTPMAMAGAYAKRLSASGDSICARPSAWPATSLAVAPSVCCRRRRRIAIATRERAADDRGIQKCLHGRGRAQQGAGRGEQLDVAGASRAEHVAGQHERKPEQAAETRRRARCGPCRPRRCRCRRPPAARSRGSGRGAHRSITAAAPMPRRDDRDHERVRWRLRWHPRTPF